MDYDTSLLADAPQASRTEKQDGYNIDILDQPIQRNPSVAYRPTHRPLTAQSHPPPNELAWKENRSALRGTTRPPPPRTRSRRCTPIILLLVGIVIVAAIVGGAVGGTRKPASTVSHETNGTTTETSDPPSVTDQLPTIVLTNTSSMIPATSTNATVSSSISSAGCGMQTVDGISTYGSPTIVSWTAVTWTPTSSDYLTSITSIAWCAPSSQRSLSASPTTTSSDYGGVQSQSTPSPPPSHGVSMAPM
ncbi:hypothetical protein JAAARDRAFT_60584 [Jaapia argillacea MUCL 33604]|uniref:Uncharacterized protein n=1 Tax=Jaapia argillacea MUCL 33604 TaxID=933084 RepID=A0A067PLA6_9AGAM|nr:hypothetical protein JAAARDRAFT_60584 [Jaapia argillacea MUCL 33604]